MYSCIEIGYVPGVKSCHPLAAGDFPGKDTIYRARALKGDGKIIEERPQATNTRENLGHFERDCTLFGKGKSRSCLLVLSERKYREVIIRKLQSARAESVVKALIHPARKLGGKTFGKRFKSISMDNGAEFNDWRSLKRSCLTEQNRASAYDCHPYIA